MNTKLGLALTALASCYGHSCFADTRTIERLLALPLHELLEVKVTSSTLYEESIHTAPSSVTVIKADEIKLLGVNRLTELMNYVPGFQAHKTDTSSLTYAYSSRGHSVSATAREILIVIDGHRVNADWTGGTTFFLPYISLDNIEQVEFIRGPGSAIYGSNAFLGVIDIKTKTDNQVSLAAGSHQSHKASVQYAHTNDQEDKYLSFFIKDDRDDGESLKAFDPVTSSFTDIRDQSDNQEAFISSRYGDFEMNGRWVKREMAGYYNGGFVSDDNFRTSKSYYLDFRHNKSLSEKLDITSKVHWDVHKNDNLIGQLPGLFFHNQVREEEHGLTFLAKYNQDTHTRWLTGLEFNHALVTDSQAQLTGLLNQTFPLSKEDHRITRGLFGQYQSDLNEKTSYLLGGRIDDYSDTGSHFSPRFALIHTLDQNNTVKLLYGEAFRAPTRVETDLTNAPGVRGNPNIDPEISKTTELVWVHTKENTFFTATIFDTQLKDSIIQSNATPSVYENGGDLTIAGLEVELHQEFLENWNTRIAITHIFDEVQNNNDESDTLLSASLGYVKKTWSANISANYQSEKLDETIGGINRLGGFTTIDTNFIYSPVADWEVFTRVQNLFDKNYKTPSSRSTNTDGIPNRRTTAELGVRWNFD